MLFYSLLATLYLAYLGIGGERVGRLLWPAVAIHAILSLRPGLRMAERASCRPVETPGTAPGNLALIGRNRFTARTPPVATKVHTLNAPQGARRKNEKERVTSEPTDD